MRFGQRSKLVVLCAATSMHAFAGQGDAVAGYRLLTTISIPGGLTANDISWVDSANARYYLADRGSTSATPPVAPRIDVIDTQSFQWITSITLPAAGNGVVGIPRAHELWVGLNDSTVAVISTDTNTIKTVISTDGTGRADEVAFDPLDRLILIANDRDSPPFVTFISTDTHSVVKRLSYTASPRHRRPMGSSSPYGMRKRENSISPYRRPKRTPMGRWMSSIRCLCRLRAASQPLAAQPA